MNGSDLEPLKIPAFVRFLQNKNRTFFKTGTIYYPATLGLRGNFFEEIAGKIKRVNCGKTAIIGTLKTQLKIIRTLPSFLAVSKQFSMNSRICF